MKVIPIIAGFIIIVCLFFFFSGCRNNTAKAGNETKKAIQGDTTPAGKEAQEAYNGLRDMALNTTAAQLELNIAADQVLVYGVVMDWDLGEGIATLVSFSTGDASMYLSSGGGVIGGGPHENVSRAAKELVHKGQQYLSKMDPTTTTPQPDKSCVRFYLLTNKGKFYAQEKFANIENKTSAWLPLFEECNKVITELRSAGDTK